LILINIQTYTTMKFTSCEIVVVAVITNGKLYNTFPWKFECLSNIIEQFKVELK